MFIRQLQDEIRMAYGTKAEVDPRNPKPFPDTSNKVYGWLVARPDFRLEKYGPDVEPLPELPDIYKIK
ncbi:PREDICTED: uncharacterized protein LOC108569888 [Nicrophorus vespilloides]|uniref:Uncharacterized protein LOC108569888 n=1 Tax=Nicrophorus vespilloides TaxID=110193 RepID=A0ABM1NJX8_NICVS|nr:PREDICTED: uncharacterized protein LOC108569888 [Nicrophorus vespilloides]